MVCLKGKVALITGASSGIGASTAVHFASLGCAVAVNGRNAQKLNATVAECLKTGIAKDKVLAVVGDVSKEEDNAAIVQKTVSHFGKLDILVNNAGFSIISPDFLKISLADYDTIMNTNLRGLFHLIQLVAPHLKKTKGNIVNVSSAVTHRLFNSSHVYATSKAGVDHLTRVAALSLVSDGIRVNCINPGGTKTNFFEAAGIPDKKIVEKIQEDTGNMHAMKRMADPMEIAKPIAFLASEDASFMTGSIMLVDGGYCLEPSNPNGQ